MVYVISKGASHECRLPNKAFSASKVLVMEYLSELTNLWKVPTQLVWLGNLMSVHVWHCEKLESKFSLFIARALVQLQDLSIGRCDMMEIIVSSEGGQHEIATDKIEFPKLKQLHLRNLPSFTAICKAMNIIELPQPSYLALWEIPKLKRLCLLQIQRVIVIPSFNPSSTRRFCFSLVCFMIALFFESFLKKKKKMKMNKQSNTGSGQNNMHKKLFIVVSSYYI
ncbi:uncharacterized protein LOC114279214 isoform X1 [Camellia sinensis]|uniref:uncharacterized protein LOC114279214 isoform X1 n=1 Tax=Camellia sinensis TaxID=4442 RepID=UPI0010360423|nr:uncharacterized protein LOC114279214 isoform X1 [Camellia sinensis]